MAFQATQHPSNSGALNLAAVANGDTVEYGSGTNTVLIVQNTDASSHTLTINASGSTSYGVANPAYTVAVPAGAVKVVPLRREFDNGAGVARATLTFDAVTGVKVAVLQVP